MKNGFLQACPDQSGKGLTDSEETGFCQSDDIIFDELRLSVS